MKENRGGAVVQGAAVISGINLSIVMLFGWDTVTGVITQGRSFWGEGVRRPLQAPVVHPDTDRDLLNPTVPGYMQVSVYSADAQCVVDFTLEKWLTHI